MTLFLGINFIVVFPGPSQVQAGSNPGGMDQAVKSTFLLWSGIQPGGVNQTGPFDKDGTFEFIRSAGEEQPLVIHHSNAAYRQVSGTVSAGGQTGQNVEQDEEPAGGDRIFVTEPGRQQARALKRQRESQAVRSVLTSDQMDRFVEYSVEDALRRLPGVHLGRDGRANIRGTGGIGTGGYTVTVDGQRMATTALGTRSVDLSGISADMVQSAEIIKVVTPDMHADALHGIVNLQTSRLSSGNERDIGVRAGGGAHPHYFDYTGLGSRVRLDYSEMLRDDFSYSMYLTHQQTNSGREALGIDYDVVDFGSGAEDVVTSISPALHTDERSWTGGGLELDYRPSDQTRYYVRTFLNSSSRDANRYRTRMSAEGDWTSADTTGSRSNYTYDMQHQNFNINQYMVYAGAAYDLNILELEYDLGWSSGRMDQDRLLSPFQMGRLEYVVNMDNRAKPQMNVIDTDIRPQDLDLQYLDDLEEIYVDNTFTGSLDILFPFRLGELKLGSSALLSYNKADYRDSRYEYRGAPPALSRFDFINNNGPEIFDRDSYQIPWIVNQEQIRGFLSSNRVALNPDRERERVISDQRNYEINENIFAGYGMTTFEIGNVVLSGGMRIEHTNGRYEGKLVEFNMFGRHEDTSDTSRTRSYTNVFPNARIQYSPGERTNVRLAYSTTIVRPDFYQLAFFEQTNIREETVFRGNPGLDPMTSDNLDAVVEHYFSDLGLFSVAPFYKALSGFIYQRQRTIDEDEEEFGGWQEYKFDNGDETASIYGVEVSWQRNLTFLPGLLSNMGTFANYTWSQSTFDVAYRDDQVDLPGQSPHVVNAALQYNQGRFSGQVAYHWTAERLYHLQSTPQMAPSINGADQVFMDQYADGFSDVSVSLRFRISEHFRFWVDASNILGDEERLRYDHTRSAYPRHVEARRGFEFRTGLQFNL